MDHMNEITDPDSLERPSVRSTLAIRIQGKVNDVDCGSYLDALGSGVIIII